MLINNSFAYTDAVDNDFQGCAIIGMEWQKLGRKSQVMLPFSFFTNCTLKYNIFSDFNMKKMDFSNSNLQGTMFMHCDLRDSNFRYTGLGEAVLRQDDLRGSDFRDAVDYSISPEENRLKKAKFSFPEVIRLLDSTGIIID